jgi:signal transduction histidine kinase
MSGISFKAASSFLQRWEPALRMPSSNVGRRIDLGLFAFCLAMLVLMQVNAGEETIPYHFLFLSLTIIYGFRVWPIVPTVVVLVAVTVTTGAIMVLHFVQGYIDEPELAEVVLMPALVVAMVWHARRRAAAQAAVEVMAEQQRDMLERQREFFRNTSHAIRTPVTIARGHLELADDEMVVPQAREDVGVALRQLDRMTLLSNRLLALAQLDAGEVLPSEPVCFRELFVELGSNWSAGAHREWVINCPDEKAVVMADRERLGQAVDALVENAVHFTADNGRIELAGIVSERECLFRVSDDGPGIAAEDLDHVFERFWHRRPPDGPMGSGLGLSMALATARACHGTVRAFNNPQGGAAFELSLPRIPAVPRPQVWAPVARPA